ncbi:MULTISPECIES: hypothetical protein [Brevibacillus]|uniref:hypothetical protein n=1 Tax=Brevibacillus TaxID=55080 RepID=UPI001F6261BA|nr:MULTISPECIES: hypothetical protein [Brevibacillus]MDH6348628.1 hypothetical protein [Brevibacillus sp. 1238]MDR5002228.1 hypothetical protein [Brevibacillus parabrevis]
MTATVWTPYEDWRGHPADFRVKYRFYSEAESGRKLPPVQGYRSDFSYAGDNEKIELFALSTLSLRRRTGMSSAI